MGSLALLRKQCESQHGRFSPEKSPEQMKARGCFIVGLLMFITWTWGRGMTLRSAQFLWPQFPPLYHRHLGIDVKNEKISLLIMTVHHAVKTTVCPILTLPITCFLGKSRLGPVTRLPKVILLISIEAEIPIQACLIPKTLEVLVPIKCQMDFIEGYG